MQSCQSRRQAGSGGTVFAAQCDVCNQHGFLKLSVVPPSANESWSAYYRDTGALPVSSSSQADSCSGLSNFSGSEDTRKLTVPLM